MNKNSIRFLLLVLLAIVALIYAMFQGGFVSWFVFYSLLPVVSYSLLILFAPLRHWEVTRTIDRGRFVRGESINIQVNVKRKWPFPLFYIVVDDQLPEPLIVGSQNGVIYFPWFQRNFSLHYKVDSLHRGLHQLDEIKISTGDLFGLIKKELTFNIKDQLLVYPSYKSMPISLNTHFNGGTVHSMKRNSSADDLMVAGIREFQPGDKRSMIDWKATAKRQMVMTKEFEMEQGKNVVILMDKHVQQEKEDFERVVSLTASIVVPLLQQGHSVEFVEQEIIGSQMILHRKAAVDTLLYTLATVKKDAVLPLYQMIDQEKSVIGRKQIILITSLVSADLFHSIEKLPLETVKLHIVSKRVSNEEKQLLEQYMQRGMQVTLF